MEKTSSPVMQHFISLSLADEFFAVNVQYVVQVLQAASFTRVPQAPPFLKGVTNFNGSVIPVINTYLKFGFSEPQDTVHQLVIVLNVMREGNNTPIGIIVDESDEVFEIDPAEIKPYPVKTGKYNTDFIDGVIHRKGRFMLVLNVEKLFSKEEIDDFVNQK